MADLIVLPALSSLTDGVYTADTIVWRISSPAKPIRCTLAQALIGLRRPVVLLHPQDARIAQVKLPRLPAEKLARAAALALEEQILTDPQELVLAIGERDNTFIRLSFTDRQVLAQLKSTLTQLGHMQTPIGAVATALKENAIWVEGEQACVFRKEDCAVLPKQALALVTGQLPHCTVYGSELENTTALGLPEDWTIKPGLPPFTLPSMLFMDSKARQATRRLWRTPAILAVLCIITWVGGLSLWWQLLKLQSHQMQAAIAQQFAKVLPGTPILDPVLQLQRVTQGGGQLSPFERVMLAADKAAASLPAQTVLAADYAGEKLTLKLAKEKLSPAVKTQFETAARNAHLRISWLSAESVAVSMAEEAS